jgi:transcriptional regulator
MYQPAQFEEKQLDVLHRLILAHPFGTLVTLDSSGLNANHIPFEIDPETSPSAPFGTLRAHVARANPVWRDFDPAVAALAVFQGAHAYITPSWYQTRQETGKVVPTWNYMVVHASGPLRIIDDAAWLRAAVERLTARHEAAFDMPWKVADAPDDYIDKQLAAIIGIEIPLTKLIGKWKVSQNRPQADREGVVQALRMRGDADSAAMADAVAQGKSGAS